LSHANAFSHLRLFAAALVLYSHHFALWGRPEPGTLGVSLGGLGVAIFFGISGYLVSRSIEQDPSALNFLWRRALRIMPGLTANVVFCAVLVGGVLTTLPLHDYFSHENFASYFWNLAFSPRYALPAVLVDAPMPYAVNGSLWTLPFEVLAYLLLATLMAVFGGRPLRWAVPLLLVVSIAVAVQWRPVDPVVVYYNDLRHVPRFMGYFLAGSCIALWNDRLPRLHVLVWLLGLYAVFDDAVIRQAIMILAIPLMAVVVGEYRPSHVLRNDVSYGLYLYAYPVQQSLIALAKPLGFWMTMLLAFAITTVLAYGSWRLVEQPALRLKPRRKMAAGGATVLVDDSVAETRLQQREGS